MGRCKELRNSLFKSIYFSINSRKKSMKSIKLHSFLPLQFGHVLFPVSKESLENIKGVLCKVNIHLFLHSISLVNSPWKFWGSFMERENGGRGSGKWKKEIGLLAIKMIQS